MKQQIYIGKDKWFLDDLAMLEKSGLKLKGISIKVDFLQSIDEIQNIWKYDIYNFINKGIEFLNHNIPNKYYCNIKNPYALKAAEILYNKHTTRGKAIYGVIKVCKDGKVGLIDEYYNTIIPLENDVIYPAISPSMPYLIVKKGDLAYMYNVLKYQIVSNIYDDIKKYSYSPSTFDSCCRCFKVSKNGKCGLMNEQGEEIAGPVYDDIITFPYYLVGPTNSCRGYFKIFKNGKCGVMNVQGEEIVAPIYDDCNGVYEFIDNDEKATYYVVVTRNGKKGILNELGECIVGIKYDEIYISNSCNLFKAKGQIGSDESILIDCGVDYIRHSGYDYERPTYERYGGTYAQDEMGFSDDDIDTIFDGDPSAYWNID